MDFARTDEQESIRSAVRSLCAQFPDEYWRELDRKSEYPERFVRALTDAGWLGALIPTEYGGAGLGLSEAALIIEEINASGGNAAAAHAQMYTMGTLLRHGSDEQKRRYLPQLAKGELRLQAFGVTEPEAGSETTRIKTMAVRRGDHFVVNGKKIFISRAEHSDLLLLLARTTPYEDLEDKTQGLSVFLVDLRAAVAAKRIVVRPIETMFNHHTTELFIDDLEVPASNLVGEEGMGFRHIIDSWNAERILIASESLGDGRWFVARAAAYASQRVVFGRPIAANQGVQFPLAQAHARLEAASLMRDKAAWLFDHGRKCGAEANMAKLLASQAAWDAANAAIDAYGGYGFAREFDVERKFRETRLLLVAPIGNNLVLAYIGQHVLGMPRSYCWKRCGRFARSCSSPVTASGWSSAPSASERSAPATWTWPCSISRTGCPRRRRTRRDVSWRMYWARPLRPAPGRCAMYASDARSATTVPRIWRRSCGQASAGSWPPKLRARMRSNGSPANSMRGSAMQRSHQARSASFPRSRLPQRSSRRRA